MDLFNSIQKILTRSMSSEEEILFNERVEQSEAEKMEYGRLKAVWNVIRAPEIDQNIDIEKAKKHFWLKASVKKSKTFLLQDHWYKIAAVFLLLMVSGFLLFNFWLNPQIKLVSTDEIVRTILPDGSKVWLHKGSELSYNKSFNSTNRNLNLTGLAFFEVSEDKDKPFVIACIDGSVTVVGTSFEVKSYENDTRAEVSVSTGKVMVDFGEDNEPVLLKKNDKINYHRNTNALVRTNTSNNELSWKTGSIVFNNTPIQEALDVLSEYFHKNFILKDESSCYLTTSFSEPEEKEVIEELTFLLSAKIITEDNLVIVEALNCK